MSDLYTAFSHYFELVQVTTPELLDEVHRLRYEVYSREIRLRGYEAWRFPDLRERDEFDSRSVHCVLRHKATQQVAGSFRLVLANSRDINAPFPVELKSKDIFDQESIRLATRIHTAEISRLILSRSFRKRKGELGTAYGNLNNIREPEDKRKLHFPHPVLGLMVGIVQLSEDNDITHWLSYMDPCLNRLMARFGLALEPIGKQRNGKVGKGPFHSSVSRVLNRAYDQYRPVWELLTQKGKVFGVPRIE